MWLGVVGTESLQPELPGRFRWVQMEQRRNQVDLPAVVLVRFSGKPEQDIPGHRDMIGGTPLEADNILHRRHALVHRL